MPKRTSKEYDEFDSLMGKLLTVPKSTISERKKRTIKEPRSSRQAWP
jgi:hypothetical protein